MKIGPLENRTIGSFIEIQGRQVQPKPADQEKTDRIDISSEARARLAAEQSGGDSVRQSSTADTSADARLDEVRQRIETGFYDREEVKQVIADRLVTDIVQG